MRLRSSIFCLMQDARPDTDPCPTARECESVRTPVRREYKSYPVPSLSTINVERPSRVKRQRCNAPVHETVERGGNSRNKRVDD